MSFKISEIKGAVVVVNTHFHEVATSSEIVRDYRQALDAQANVKMGLNREKLANIIARELLLRNFDMQGFSISKAIIAAELDIVEVEK